MPSGAADLQRRDERVHPAAAGSAASAQGNHLGRVEAVGAAGRGAAGAPFGGAGTGAEAAMQPAAPVPHGRLAAAFAGASVSAAAGRGEKVAGRRAVPEPAAAGGRQADGGVGMRSGHADLLADISIYVRQLFYTTDLCDSCQFVLFPR
jgi:hypothetical protein